LGVARDYIQARYWYEKAAEQGNALAQNNLGVLYWYGHGVRQDRAKARQLYELAASQGNIAAKRNLETPVQSGNAPTWQPAPGFCTNMNTMARGFDQFGQSCW